MTGQIITRTDGNVVTLFGHYTVDTDHDMVTVRSPYGTKSTQIGGSPPEMLAKILLRELAEDRC